LQVPGDLRGVEAQPLVISGVKLNDGTTRDVIYLATMANQVLAFDLANGARLWQRTLGRPVDPGGKINGNDIDAHHINDHWGVLSTPVIDQDTDTMYLVAWISPDGSVVKAQHFVYAISTRDGQDVHPAINLEGTTYDPGHGLPVQRFRSAARKQRAALLLTSITGVKSVFIAFGSILESSDTARGWIIACGTAPFAINAAWTSTALGSGAGIWQAGAGLAADAAGSIYAMTGNGAFDAITDWGESFIKLQYTPPGGEARTGSLAVVDWWAPWTDGERIAGPQGRAQSVLTPRHAATHRPLATNFRAYATLGGADGWDDMDLGSGGPVLILSHRTIQGAVVGAGKDGILYIINQAQMGKTKPTDLQNPAANYAKLMAPPIFFTYYPPQLSPSPQNIQTLNLFYANMTHHLHGNPIYWDSPDRGPLLYCWGENGNLRAWSVAPNGSVSYLACSAEMSSAQSPVPFGGMPGGMLTLSANGAQQHCGVVWALIPYFNANTVVGPGRLLAYDATQFGAFADGSKQLQVLWDSERWALTFSFNKFNPPIVANGRLIVPTYDARVDVYGL
jgi:hypothetical protein